MRETIMGKAGAASIAERMRAAAIRGQAAALEMSEAAAEMLGVANEVEDYAQRQEEGLVRLRGPAAPPKDKPGNGAAKTVTAKEETEDTDGAKDMARVLSIGGKKVAEG